jgi:hypothetical protein
LIPGLPLEEVGHLVGVGWLQQGLLQILDTGIAKSAKSLDGARGVVVTSA